MFSVVVPAHNEAAVIGRCLEALARQRLEQVPQVIVVANGCTDDTVEVARRYAERLPGMEVIDLEAAGKSLALNAGDAAATTFPRIYLDADIELGPDVLEDLATVLLTEAAAVAAPSVRFDVSGASLGVQAFYSVFRRLPYATAGLVGLGVYGLSAAGRQRFDRFPELTGDDLFVQRLFSPAERLTSPGEFVVRTPKTLSALIQVRTRVAFGNAELAASGSPGTEAATVDTAPTTRRTLGALGRIVLKEPALVPAAAVYVWVTVRARRAARGDRGGVWRRDETSRT